MRVVRPGKTQQRSCFLFDHQLVYCKKDVLRRDILHYRGRLDTDSVVPMDLPDGRHTDLGMLRNAFALRNHDTLEVLCVLSCRKAQDKQLWLEAFSQERRRVKEDEEMGELLLMRKCTRFQRKHKALPSKRRHWSLLVIK